MASRGINKVILIGNCGADPEVRYTQNSVAIANLSVATSETWKDKQSGEQREQTEWHRVVCYKRLAEIAGEYLRKGSKVYIEGRLQTRKWQGQDGKDNYTTEIVCNEMQMLDPPTKNQGAGGFGGQVPAGNGGNRTHGQAGGAQHERVGAVHGGGFQAGVNNQGGYQNQQNPTYAQGTNANQPDPRKSISQQVIPDEFDDDIPY